MWQKTTLLEYTADFIRLAVCASFVNTCLTSFSAVRLQIASFAISSSLLTPLVFRVCFTSVYCVSTAVRIAAKQLCWPINLVPFVSQSVLLRLAGFSMLTEAAQTTTENDTDLNAESCMTSNSKTRGL